VARFALFPFLMGCLFLLVAVSASAQSPPSNVVAALEEEINLLKETIEENNRAIRTLRERITNQATEGAQHAEALENIRRRIARIDVLQTELQALEARVMEALATDDSEEADRLQMHAEVRIRPEYTQNREDLNSQEDDQDGFWGHRARIAADFGFDDWVRARVSLQDARKFGSRVGTDGGVGIHEAWLELTPPLIPGLRIRAGRTEMSYGAERLLGRNDFDFAGQSFDGVVVRAGHLPYFDIEAFYAKLQESDTPLTNDDDFFGAYMMTEAIPDTVLELYYMGLLTSTEREGVEAGATVIQEFSNTIHSIGARVEGLYFDSLRVEAEAVIQLGTRTDPNDATRELEHFATAYFGEIGYQAPILTHPTLSAFFAYASGDANPNDLKSIDFQPLFPTRHSFLGTMDVMAWSNIIDVGGKLELTPPLGFGFFAGFHYFMLAQKRGALYGLGNGLTVDVDQDSNPDVIGRSVGMEVDVAVSWAPNDNLQIQAGYSIFLPGTVLERLEDVSASSPTASEGDRTPDAAHWAYLQTRVQF
jgi:hypothetical protein